MPYTLRKCLSIECKHDMAWSCTGDFVMSLPASSQPVCFVITANRPHARAFYADVLGLRLLGEDDHAATFDVGNRTALRLSDFAEHKPSGQTVLGWNVADIRESVRALTAKGVKFHVFEGMGQDADGVWQSPAGGASVAWFSDPDGNVLSLTQFG
jgi:catechol 2,3-dioxygenase-like lactoylglutathione lyase family enzyme